MPKDEFDFEDPLELNGVSLLTEEDTTEPMCESFVEEFARMGYNPKQILALFRNPHYLGMNLVLQNRGEPYVRGVITDTFARWGKAVQWPDHPITIASEPSPNQVGCEPLHHQTPEPELPPVGVDPLGNPVPAIRLDLLPTPRAPEPSHPSINPHEHCI
jgi:hypothetical protein